MKKAKINCMADVHAVDVEWLWEPYLPRGKVTIIRGMPGDGKMIASLDSNVRAHLQIGRFMFAVQFKVKCSFAMLSSCRAISEKSWFRSSVRTLILLPLM